MVSTRKERLLSDLGILLLARKFFACCFFLGSAKNLCPTHMAANNVLASNNQTGALGRQKNGFRM